MIKNQIKKIVKTQSGFSIIEAAVFLAVSAALFGASVFAISAQSKRTAFSQAVRDFDLQIQDIMNDAETGYYASDNNLARCNGASEAERGTNAGCIFLGKAIEFYKDGEDNRYQVHTVVGNAGNLSSGLPSGDIKNANPRIGNDLDEEFELGYGLEVVKIVHGTSGTPEELDGFGVLSTLGRPLTYAGSVNDSSGALQFTLYKVGGPAGSFSSKVDAIDDSKRANKTITVCLSEEGGGRKAHLQVGINNQRLSTTSVINSWDETICE